MHKNDANGKVRTNIRLDASVHKELKLAAIALEFKSGKRVTMEQLGAQAIREFLDRLDPDIRLKLQ
jgi:hypothetical protein